jgi:hypothetical protein
MPSIYSNYPHGLPTKKLEAAIREYSDAINLSGANINTVLQFSPYISLGLNELQNRQNSRVTRVSIGIGIVSLIVSIFAFYVAIDAARSGDASTARQIKLLETLNENAIQGKTRLSEISQSLSRTMVLTPTEN